MHAGDAFEPVRDGREFRWVDLSVLLDPLLAIARLQHPANLVEEERECMEDGRSVRRGPRAVGDRREESPDRGFEPRLFERLPYERVEDAFAVMDAAGSEPVGATRIEGLDREKDFPVRAPHDHADLADAVRVMDRIEEAVIDRRVDPPRFAVSGRELSDLLVEIRHSLAIVLAQDVLERFTEEHGLLRLLPLGKRLEPRELGGAVVRRLQDHVFGRWQADGVPALLLGGVEREIGLAHELLGALGVARDVGDADRGGCFEPCRNGFAQRGGKVGAKTLGAKERGLERNAGRHEGELVPTDAAEGPALRARLGGEHARRRRDRFVAESPTSLLVQDHEVVQVDQEERGASLGLDRFLDRAPESRGWDGFRSGHISSEHIYAKAMYVKSSEVAGSLQDSLGTPRQAAIQEAWTAHDPAKGLSELLGRA